MCLHSRIYRNSMNLRRTTLRSHIWSRRKVLWRHAGVSRASYIALALNDLKKVRGICNENTLETLSGMYSASCSNMSKPCDETVARSTPAVMLSRKQKRVRFRKHQSSTVKPLPFITHPKRVKKRIQFRRKSCNCSQRLVLTPSIAESKIDMMTKRKSRRKKVSSLTRRLPPHKIYVPEKEHEGGPAYYITPKKLLQAYKPMRKGRSFHASERVLWRNRRHLPQE